MPVKKRSMMNEKKRAQPKEEKDNEIDDPKKEANYEKLSVEEEPEFKPPKMISAVTVLLNAVQMAQQRGVYNMNEIGIIHKAYELLLEHERKRDEKLRFPAQ